MNILVTGANGFVGRHLSKTLLERGYAVKGTVRSREKIISMPDAMDISIVGDISPTTDWRDVLKGIDVIVHLAARVHVMTETSDNPLQAFRHVNTVGTERLAMQAGAAGVKRIVYLSTIKVNGEKTIDKPFTENDSPAPDDPYSVSKWEAEQSIRRIAEQTGLEYAIIRPTLVYGTGVKGNFLMLMKLINKGVPLPLSGIRNKRSLIYLGNLTDAIMKCISHPSAANKTFLVSDGEDLSTPELIRRMANAFGRPARLFYFPPAFLRLGGAIARRTNAVRRLADSLTVDSSKIRNELDWSPPFTLNQGLNSTIDWFKNSESGL
ncbi:UDP-glucose 4-epimerase family protein [Candidatus Magnetominusculus dajiuhuensis]|uniref:UDP-glucose 4-epimerase family protein n=1 Tax=Candidatus Magnetominusculus dajiuhuensis TaxID=3137712 RepID=UPI003B42E8F7